MGSPPRDHSHLIEGVIDTQVDQVACFVAGKAAQELEAREDALARAIEERLTEARELAAIEVKNAQELEEIAQRERTEAEAAEAAAAKEAAEALSAGQRAEIAAYKATLLEALSKEAKKTWLDSRRHGGHRDTPEYESRCLNLRQQARDARAAADDAAAFHRREIDEAEEAHRVAVEEAMEAAEAERHSSASKKSLGVFNQKLFALQRAESQRLIVPLLSEGESIALEPRDKAILQTVRQHGAEIDHDRFSFFMDAIDHGKIRGLGTDMDWARVAMSIIRVLHLERGGAGVEDEDMFEELSRTLDSVCEIPREQGVAQLLRHLEGIAAKHTKASQHQQAIAVLERACQIAGAHMGPHSVECGHLRFELGKCLRRDRKFPEATKCLQECLQSREKRLLAEQGEARQGRQPAASQHAHAVAVCLNELAHVLVSTGCNKEALSLLERSHSIVRQTDGEGSASHAAALTNLGGVWKALGDTAKAQGYFDESVRFGKETYGRGTGGVLRLEGNKMAMAMARGETGSAEAFLTTSLDRATEKTRGQPQSYTSQSRISSALRGAISMVRSREGDVQGALSMLEAALRSTAEVSRRPLHRDSVLLGNLLAAAALEVGDWRRSLEAAKHSVAVSREIWGEGSRERGAGLVMLARARLHRYIEEEKGGQEHEREEDGEEGDQCTPTSRGSRAQSRASSTSHATKASSSLAEPVSPDSDGGEAGLHLAHEHATESVSIQRRNPRFGNDLISVSGLSCLAEVCFAKYHTLGDLDAGREGSAAVKEAAELTERVLGEETWGVRKALALRDMARLYHECSDTEEEALLLYERCGQLLALVQARAYPSSMDSFWEACGGCLSMAHGSGGSYRLFAKGMRQAQTVTQGSPMPVKEGKAILARLLSWHLDACEPRTEAYENRYLAYLEHKHGLNDHKHGLNDPLEARNTPSPAPSSLFSL